MAAAAATNLFGEFLRAAREALPGDVSQEFIAGQLGMGTKSAYSKYEVGRIRDISPERLTDLCSLLKVSEFDAIVRLTLDKYRGLIQDRSDPDAVEEQAKWDLLHSIVFRKESISAASRLAEDRRKGLLSYELRAHTIALQKGGLLDMQGLAYWEKYLEAPNNFWIASDQLFDGPDTMFLDAVSQQLERGSRYTYFLPKRLATFRFDTLKAVLQAKLQQEKVAVEVVGLEDDDAWEVLGRNSYIIVNPTVPTRRAGFLCTVNGSMPELAYEMRELDYFANYLGHRAESALELHPNSAELIRHITGP